ncbi:MAG: ribosome biogenesis GTPase Der [Micavibrio sp.]|nr:ribosome biogenesis GTPase Der [Micavibrio sp.]
MNKKYFKVALIGRPNVGKSTLFNKIIGKQMAIVDDRPGVTRDFREADIVIQGKAVTMIDTAGMENEHDQSMFGRMRQQTEKAIEIADLLVFVMDGREGVTPLDAAFAKELRKIKKDKILVVNKCESSKGDFGIADSYSLGFGEPLPVSAEHGLGIGELSGYIVSCIPEESASDYDVEEEEKTDEDFDRLDALEGQEEVIIPEISEEEKKKPIKLAIVGRPNVGKSTLVNALLNEKRVMTGPEAGVTRDAIAIDWVYQDTAFKLVDTAGLRRKSKVVDPIEKMSTADSYRAIRLAQIVVLVIDGTLGLDKQDIQIAAHAIEEGRALVLAINKWDAMDTRAETMDQIKDRIELSLGQIKDLPIQMISAQNARNLDKLMDRVLEAYDYWNRRTSTGKVNRWLDAVVSHHPPPLYRGKPNKLRYMTQINTRPPTFAMWLSSPKDLPDSYVRYMTNKIREDFDLPGTPIRILLRKSKNPYADR